MGAPPSPQNHHNGPARRAHRDRRHDHQQQRGECDIVVNGDHLPVRIVVRWVGTTKATLSVSAFIASYMTIVSVVPFPMKQRDFMIQSCLGAMCCDPRHRRRMHSSA